MKLGRILAHTFMIAMLGLFAYLLLNMGHGFVAGAVFSMIFFHLQFWMHYGWFPGYGLDGEDDANRLLPTMRR